MGLFGMGPQGYTFGRTSLRAGARTMNLTVPACLYAEVALELNLRDVSERLFTYEVPAHLSSEIFVGSQVLVPFGKQEQVAGYVVSIKDRIDLSEQAYSGKMRLISEVLDSSPLFAPAYIQFLYWIADYYLCSFADVISAAIPSEIGPRFKRMVRLAVSRESSSVDSIALLNLSPQALSAEERLKSLLGSAQALSQNTLKERSRLSGKDFYASLARLRRKGEIEIFAQADDLPGPKLVSQVFWTGSPGKTKRQEEILSHLKRANGGMLLQKLIEESASTHATIKRMVNEGILSVVQVDSVRDPLKNCSFEAKDKPALTEQQERVFASLSLELDKCLERSQAPEVQESPWLLHGVTGSGKTEIYMRLIERTLAGGRSALLLVPEISLTPQLAQNLLSRFGQQVAVWHSALSAGERFDTFGRVRSGELKLVLGARSAILFPIPDLGLIILDEEHDSSYKQSTPSPRYSAKFLACRRGWQENCMVLFGSATPDAATYLEAKRAKRILELPERVHKQPLPESVLVDMRTEFVSGNRSVISRLLESELNECIANAKQAILLINRRGYSSHVFCRACGHVLMCRHCSVSLVFHNNQAGSSGARLSCHHCGYSQANTEICPSCTSPFLKQFGLGTQKVEEECRSMFPQARILRLDSDVTSRKGAVEDVFQKFSAGHADILIGTQIVAKGLDIPNVTLVGVLAADAAFNLPDFRSLERGFQLLTQVSGRAGRGRFPGKVVLQTHNTELPALLMAKRQDYGGFIEEELAHRKEFEYPPYSRLVRVLASGPDQQQVQQALEKLAEELSNYLEDLESIRILGPAPCLIERIKGQFRQHIIIKNLLGELGQKAISSFFKGRRSMPGVRLTIDVDPVDLI